MPVWPYIGGIVYGSMALLQVNKCCCQLTIMMNQLLTTIRVNRVTGKGSEGGKKEEIRRGRNRKKRQEGKVHKGINSR